MFKLYINIVLVKIYRYFKVLYENGYSRRPENVIVYENKPIKWSNIGLIFIIYFNK